MSGNSLETDGTRILAEVLKTNTTLKELILKSDAKNDPAWKNILTSFQWTENNIGSIGGRIIAEALESNTTLTRLNLSSINQIYIYSRMMWNILLHYGKIMISEIVWDYYLQMEN